MQKPANFEKIWALIQTKLLRKITRKIMKKKWSAKEKSLIVLEGLCGRLAVDICTTYGVSQSLYYS